MKEKKWFRPSGGSVFHLHSGYQDASFGLHMLKTACGKAFFEGEKYLRGDKKRCAKCEKAAQQTYALDGATCPAHGLKLVDGYCPSLTCVYSPPRK